MLKFIRSARLDVAGIVLLVGLALYLPTLQPGIGWYNAPELVCAALTLDVPHSPGYPLFTRLAAAAIELIPWGDPAWRVNLLSAILGAAAAAAWAAWLAGWGIRRGIAVCIGIWLLAVPTFWEQATSSEVYTLECLLFALFMLVMQSVRTGRIGFGTGLLAGMLLAAGIGHRPTFAVLAGASVFSIMNTGLWARIGSSAVTGALCGLSIGALPTMDLFLRLQNENRVLIDPMIGRGIEGFWNFFSGADYRNAIGVFDFSELLERSGGWLAVVSGAGIWMPLLGAAALLTGTASWRIFSVCLWMIAVNTGFVLNYNAFEAHTMLLPTLMAVGGLAAVTLSHASRRSALAVTVALILATGISVPVAATRIESRSRDSEVVTRRISAVVPKNAVLMMNNDIEFRPFYYLRLTKKFRPDLGIRLVDALTASDAADLDGEATRGALFGSLIFPASAASVLGARYTVEPWGYLWRIRKQGPSDFMDAIPSGWQRLEIGAGASLSLDPDVQILPLGGTADRVASDVLLPGDVIVYRYAVPLGVNVKPFILKTELVDEKFAGLEHAGIKTGHDIHFVGSRDRPAMIGSSATHAVYQRTIVYPEAPKGTKLQLTMCIVDLTDSAFPKWVTTVLPEGQRLNAEGATELFRLRYGMGGKPLFLSDKTCGIDAASSSKRISAARFRASPNIP